MYRVCFVKQKTAYVMRISDWSSDVCSSDLLVAILFARFGCLGLVVERGLQCLPDRVGQLARRLGMGIELALQRGQVRARVAGQLHGQFVVEDPAARAVGAARVGLAPAARKSTRLNSSH